MIKAVPMFKTTFAAMGAKLPGITVALISVSDFFVHGWAAMLIVIIGVTLALKLFKRTEQGRVWDGDRKLKRSLFRRINSMSSASQFANTMSTMLSSGLPMVKAMDITSNVMSNYILSRALKVSVAGVEQGRGIAECMRETGVFPELLVEMTGVGEESGNMEGTLEVIGAYYDNEVSVATSRLLTIMEPVITIGLAVMTVFLLLSVYLPMFSMYGNM
jgi:type IV pilus assembly protein PilC